MQTGNLAEDLLRKQRVVSAASLNKDVSISDLEGILHETNPETAATELAVVGLMQRESQRFESSLNSRLDQIISGIYYSEIPQRLIDKALGELREGAIRFVKKKGHNPAFIGAFADQDSLGNAAYFYNGTSKGKIIGKRIFDLSLTKDLMEAGREDGAILINPGRRIFAKNVFFFNLDLGYVFQSGFNKNNLRETYGFKDSDVNCRHFAALMISKYIPGPVFTWSETGYFRAYKNGKIMCSTYHGETDGKQMPYLLDRVRSQLERANNLYQSNIESEIEKMVKGLKKYLSFDKEGLKDEIYGLRAEYGHGPAGIFVVGQPSEKYILNGSRLPDEGVRINFRGEEFERYFSEIAQEDGACIVDDEHLLRKNAQFVNLSKELIPKGTKGGARTLKSIAFAAATGLPVIVLKENGIIKRLGMHPNGGVYSLTLSDNPGYIVGNTPSLKSV